jgi:hypothetical protein
MARGNTDKYELDKVLDAIKGSSGIKATIMRRLGCSRNTVDNYLKRYATAQAAYDEEVEIVGDLAESVIISAIKNKDVDTAKWYAKSKLKHRGYTDSVEQKHSGELTTRIVQGPNPDVR